MSSNKEKETGVFIGAYVPVDTASKLILASASSEGSSIRVSKSEIVRDALKEHLDRLSPSPSARMVSHFLSEWHTIQANAGGGEKITFESFCKTSETILKGMGVTEKDANAIYGQLKQSRPAVKTKAQ